MRIGYARVSTDEQHMDMQLQALERAGCERTYRDKGVSGGAVRRPGLDRALKALRPGDELVVWRLDRLGRSLAHLVKIINDLRKRDVEFRSLSEAIDTTTANGRFFFHMMAALAEFERGLISERTRAGMRAARERGAHIGRPKSLSEAQIDEARGAISDGRATVEEMAERFGVHRRTLEKAISRNCSP
jgi:DNA invertase Pin-like site-specific DNA recombinase